MDIFAKQPLIPSFATEAEAFEWMYEGLHEAEERCIDNDRFAYKDDEEAMFRYDEIADSGCCGSFDNDIIVAGRPAIIGCNYGH